jgi:hypothetical protein
MLHFFKHFDSEKKIMSSTVAKNSTISSSGSSSSASTSNLPGSNQNLTPTSTTNSSPFFLNPQQNVPSSPQQMNTSYNILNNLTNTPLNPLPTSVNASSTTPGVNNSSSSILHEEKVYKKEKQILVEFDTKTKGKLYFFITIF